MTQQQTMNRADLAEQVAYLEAVADEARERAAQYRATLESAAGDEYREQKVAPTWRVPGLGVVSGRVRNDTVRISNADDFLAWMRAHRPDDVETIERVRPVVEKALLGGCHLNDDGLVVTAAGDEIAGVEIVRGGQFAGIACKFDSEAKAAYRELARTALARIGLTPESAMPADDGQGAAAAGDGPAPEVAAFLATAPAVADPWATNAAPAAYEDPWAVSEPAR